MTRRWMASVLGLALAVVPVGAAAQLGNGTSAAREEAGRSAVRRQELVEEILALREGAAGRKLGPELRAALSGRLGRVGDARLEAFRKAGGLGDIEALAHDGGPSLVGESSADLVFTPVVPCRIIDTTVAGGPIGADTARSFYVTGNTAGTFESQGGTAGGCGIPDDATAVEMNFVAVGPAGPGDLRAFPFSGSPTPPLASVINYANLSGLNIANGIAQPICNSATTVCTFDMLVQADVAPTNLVVDVVGYYRTPVFSPPIRTAAQPSLALTVLCTNATTVNYSTPRAGKLLVRLDMTFRFDHVNGVLSEAGARIGTTAGDCLSTEYGNIFVSLPGALPTGTYYFSHSVARVLDVTAGPNTIFVNAFRGGGAVAVFTWGLDASFTPN